MVTPAPAALGSGTIDTRSTQSRRATQAALQLHAESLGLSCEEKDGFAAALADHLGVDYDAMRTRRLLHLVNPAEVRRLAADGIDFQLHTHHHRSPLDRDAYLREITENRRRVESYTGSPANHFCYPSGVAHPEFAGWLAEAGVVSATTCEGGMASAQTDRGSLPRFLDHSGVSPLEFDGWLTGISALIPRRRVGFQPVDRDGKLVLAPRMAPA